MTRPHVTDYSKLFEIASPPRIYGEPDYERLKKLKDILKSNASRITSELGGGGHGHLGLILSANEYTGVSNVPYIRPVHPGQLDIPAGTTQHASTTIKTILICCKNFYSHLTILVYFNCKHSKFHPDVLRERYLHFESQENLFFLVSINFT